MRKIIDMTNQQINNWTVKYMSGRNKHGHILWHCVCKCGNEKDIAGTHLKAGASKMCSECYSKNKTRTKWSKNMQTIKYLATNVADAYRAKEKMKFREALEELLKVV